MIDTATNLFGDNNKTMAATAPATNSNALNGTSDQHTLTLKVPAAVTCEQVEKAIQSALAVAEANDYKCTYLINQVKKSGAPTGRYYVRFSNPAVFHMLLGKNPDGSERVHCYEDPDWLSPEPDLGPVEIDFSAIPTKCWADAMDDEEAETAPIIREQLPALLALPAIDLTASQRVQLEAECITIRYEAALAHNVPLGMCHFTLCSSNLPASMDESFIKREFQCFSTSKRSESTRLPNGQFKQETYPIVRVKTIQKPRSLERVAFIKFDSATQDASFAFHLMRAKDYFNKATGDKITVTYHYAYERNQSDNGTGRGNHAQRGRGFQKRGHR